MSRNPKTSAIIDGILKLTVVSGVISMSVLIPGLAVALDKPTARFIRALDKRDRQREIERVIAYMKRKKLVAEYEHGITITRAGKRRLTEIEFDDLTIPRPLHWDKKWRMLAFDIPENQRLKRKQLIAKLRDLGFLPLQRSVWMHPHPCHEQVEAVAVKLCVTDYLTYAEIIYLDKSELLEKRFKALI